MCAKCDELDRLINKGLEESGANALAKQQDKESGAAAETDTVPNMMSLALMKVALLKMMEQGGEGMEPDALVRAVMWSLKPVLKAAGMGADFAFVDGREPESQDLIRHLRKAKEKGTTGMGRLKEFLLGPAKPGEKTH